MRKTLTLPLAILILAVAGCGDDTGGGADGSRGQPRQAEPEPAILWPARRIPSKGPSQPDCSPSARSS